uniref:U-exon n=1 Tax=Pacific black duck aviadenovirus TaxID=2798287 RepID=A0A7T4V7A1_9ADEN|nr:U-exon [Pacific black duck aviadenovirus]
MAESKKYWMNVNEQNIIRFDHPLNQSFLFWIRRQFNCKIHSEGGERVKVTRRKPFSIEELKRIYSETDYRQRVVSYQSQNSFSNAFLPLYKALNLAGKSVGSCDLNGRVTMAGT